MARFGATLTTAVLLTVALGGCGTVKGWFSGKHGADKPLKPTELTEFTPSLTVAKLWSTSAGKGEGRIGARQGPSIADGRVYAAAIKGGVRAFDLQTGAVAWHYDSKLPLSGGPGAGDGLVVVGSLEGDVVALDAATGAQKWTAKVGNEVIAAPVIGQGMVFVRSNDGRISAFDAASGERRWFWNHELPNLTVRGNSAPALGPGYLFVGNDDGTVTALSITDGRPLWDQTVAAAEGRTELDRMADVDGTPVLEDTTLYATSYKKQTVAIDAPNGRPLWSHDSGGPGRVGVSNDRVVVTDPAGTVWGLDKASGAAMWQQPALARRNVTGPAIQGDYAVVGDFDGYLHWLKLADGALAARMRAGGDAVRAAPVVADGVLVVQTTGGQLSAYRLGQ
ncbi:MAG TPA: outer membrane protein assembly factor BamB [Luteimonas sp.]|nr:outer membrane protein assembly factor BamB [Luteimonas sp.]